MELTFSRRDSLKKLTAKRIRRQGEIPAVLYSRGKQGENIAIDGNEFKKFIRKLPTGTLPTTVFVLKEGGREIKAILKDVQYAITSYEPIHLDFVELQAEVEVTVKVPIFSVGDAECVGVKQGGCLKQVMRYLPVRCLPKDIPARFELDVKEMNLGQVRRIGDIVFPEGVKPLLDLRFVAIVIAKKE